jgi:hypothetical protein
MAGTLAMYCTVYTVPQSITYNVDDFNNEMYCKRHIVLLKPPTIVQNESAEIKFMKENVFKNSERLAGFGDVYFPPPPPLCKSSVTELLNQIENTGVGHYHVTCWQMHVTSREFLCSNR